MIKEDCEVGFGEYAGGSGNVDDNVTYSCCELTRTLSVIIKTNGKCNLTWLRWQVNKGSMSDWMYYESLTFREQVKRYRRRRCRHLLSRWRKSSRLNRWTRPIGELNVVYSNIAPPNTNRGFNLYLKNYNVTSEHWDLLRYSLYLFFQSKLSPVKIVSTDGLGAVPVQNVKKCEQGQRGICLLIILIPEATNVWLLPRKYTSHRTLSIWFC